MILLTETWLNNNIGDLEIFPPTYNVYRTNRDFERTHFSRGGGVLIAVNSSLRTERLQFDTHFSIVPAVDIVGIKIYLDHSTLYVLVIYIPPSLSNENYALLFDAICQLNYLYESNILIVGDFNLPTYSQIHNPYNLPPLVKHFFDFLQFLSLHQCNKITNSLNRTLDFVIANNHISVDRAAEPLAREDVYHPCLEWSIETKLYKRSRTLANGCEWYFNFRKANFPALYNNLLHTNWEFLLKYRDVNLACEAFYQHLDYIIERFVPKNKCRSSTYPVWFTPKVIKLIKQKSHLWNKAKKSGLRTDKEKFENLRRIVKKEIEYAYKEFILHAEKNITANPQEFWKFVNLKRKNPGIPSNMTYKDESIAGGENLVRSFADHFKSVFRLSSFHNVTATSGSLFQSNILTDTFSDEKVFKKLKDLKPKFTAGPDMIPAFLVKDCAAVFCKPLKFLYNLAISTQTFPNIWKISKIIPLFKKDDRSIIENYRPISILDNFSKVFESLLFDTVSHQISNHISDYQHGFVQGRSTVTNLTSICQFISESLDSGFQTDVVYTDFSKAFDRIDHGILQNKLFNSDLSDNMCSIICSYISGRSCFVECRGFRSLPFIATSGVPQGSVLGPLIFNIFINDIVKDIKSSALLYADDLKLYRRIICYQDCIELQSDLDKISIWCKSNYLSLNLEKCYILSYSLAKQIIDYKYRIDNVLLSRPSHVKDLGVVFDTKLSFSAHIQTLTSDAIKLLGFIMRNSSSINDEAVIKLLYFSFVRCKLEYAAIVWYPHYTAYINEIENVQRRFLKYLHFKVYTTYPPRGISQEYLLQTFSISSIAHRVKTGYLRFFTKLIGNEINCSHLLSLLKFNCPKFNVRSNNILYLRTPRTNILMYSPMYNICRTVNIVHPKLDIFCCRLSDIKKLSFGSL